MRRIDIHGAAGGKKAQLDTNVRITSQLKRLRLCLRRRVFVEIEKKEKLDCVARESNPDHELGRLT